MAGPNDFAMMTDEEIMNQPSPEMGEASTDVVVEELPEPDEIREQEKQEEEKPAEVTEPVVEEKSEEKTDEVSQEKVEEKPLSDEEVLKQEPKIKDKVEEKTPESDKDKQEKKDPEIKDPKAEESKDETKDPSKDKKPEADKSEKTDTPPDYEGFYKEIMTPFKANGKMIELKDPKEAVKLMQMGANYTKKLQELQPHKKMLMMLQNNDLLDEDKLSYLIDLDKKNPEAIQKLIKDSGIDPLDIDTNTEPAYRNGSQHKVSNQDVAFTTVLDDLVSTPEGSATAVEINTTFDDASKELLWQNPEVMTEIHTQRESGIYDRIKTEMDRQKTLGQLKPDVPFIAAYTTIGDELHKNGAFDDLIKAQEPKKEDTPEVEPEQKAVVPEVKEPPKIIAKTVAAPKSSVANNDKASAAAPSRGTSSKIKTGIDTLAALSDEDFLKNFDGRV